MFEDGIVYFFTEIFFNILINNYIVYPLFFIMSVLGFFVLLVLILNTPVIWYVIKEKSKYLKSIIYYYINEQYMFIKYNITEIRANFTNYGWRQWLIIGIVIVVLAVIITFLATSYFKITENAGDVINSTINSTINTSVINN